jgi:hypothetical protein
LEPAVLPQQPLKTATLPVRLMLLLAAVRASAKHLTSSRVAMAALAAVQALDGGKVLLAALTVQTAATSQALMEAAG